MTRKFIDCGEMPSQTKCTLMIAGEEDEVVRAATLHAVDVHGHKDTPELRKELRRSLKDVRPPLR
jgi:predicted small metal-binding protein